MKTARIKTLIAMRRGSFLLMVFLILIPRVFAEEPAPSRPLIRDIKISNAYPLFNRDVEKVMTLYVGDPFNEKALQAQEKRIMDLYRNEGYLPEGVTLLANKDKKEAAYTIHITIQKGPYLRLGRVFVAGNHNVSRGSLLYHMKSVRDQLWPGQAGRFRESVLVKDMDTLTRYYRKRGFADVVIRHELSRDVSKKRVDVAIMVEEGPRYIVHDVIGNHAFYDRTLKSDLVLFEKGNRYGVGIRKSIETIKARYLKKGYPDIRVEIKVKSTKRPPGEERELALAVHEGEQVRVDQVTLSGSHSFSEKRIRKEILTTPASFFRKGIFLEETLAADILAIKALYLNEGFTEAQVSETREWSRNKNRVTLHLKIDEGPQTVVSSVQTQGDSILNDTEVSTIIRMKKGSPFNKRMLSNDETELAAALAERGFPYVTVTGESTISGNKKEADIVYHIKTGKPVKMGEVYLSGNFRTKERVIRKELEMEKGEPFSLKKMVAAQKNIRDLDIFESVWFDTTGIREKEDTVHLKVNVIESPSYDIQSGLGYESQRGRYMHGKISDRNLFGLNKKVWISYESSEIGYHGETGYVDHRFLGYRTDLSLTLYTEREQAFNQVFETRTKGAALGFRRKPWKRITTGLNLSLERREQVYDEDPEQADEGITDMRTVLVTTPSISYDNRDEFLRPKKGIFSTSSVDISRGLLSNLDNFYKWDLDNRFYLTPFSKLTLAFLLRSGLLIPSGSNTEVPDDQLFFLGGTASVRGFRENRLEYDEAGAPVGGRLAFNASAEVRFEANESIEFALFYDAGVLMNRLTDYKRERFRDSVGAGIRWLTPIGPIGLLYGVKTNPRENESRGQWHLSIGYTF